MPLEQKLAAKARYPGYPYGYLPPQSESLARSRGVEAPPDQKESFNGGPERAPASLSDPEALGFCFAPTIWPEAPPGFHEAWRAYYRALEDLAARIMGVFALALKLPEDFFAPFIDAPVSALRALNYPALSGPAKPGRIRAGAHTDYGSLTILLPQAGSRGLEILTPDARWVEVPPRPGAFVVNIGDLMARWTNDRWISTLHRVVIPEERRRAAPVLRFLPSAELGRRDRRARRLPFAGRSAKISARPLGAVSYGQVQVDDDPVAGSQVCVRSVRRLPFRFASPICRAIPQAGFTRLLI